MRPILFALSALLLAAALRPVFSQAVVVPPPKPTLHGDMVRMLDDLQLTVDQQAQVTAKIIAMQTATTQWDNAHKEQVATLRQQIKLARLADDKADAQLLQGQLQPLTDARDAITAKTEQDILALLTPEQQTTWLADQLLRQGEFNLVQKTFPLTPTQLATLKAQAHTCASAQLTLRQRVKDAQATLTALQADLDKLTVPNHAAILNLLTPEQRLTLITTDVLQKTATFFKNLQLSDAQITEAKPLCADTIKAINQAPADDATAEMTAMNKLYQTIWDEVLTAEQRGNMGKR